MGSLNNPKIWVPYTNSNDCSQTLCIFFPPPPPPLQFSGHSTPSTLLIAIIGVLASAFLLVAYYLIISKYCVNSASRPNPNESEPAQNESDDEDDHNHINHMIHEPWLVAGTGLDESLIKSIAVFKYKRPENGLIVQGTECSVCLSEFQDGESVKLLPKCIHPFHVNCIDTWLESHSNCPLCRANIVVFLPNPSSENAEPHLQDERNSKNSIIRALSDLGRLDTVIEIKDEEYEMNREIRRTVSMSMVDHVL